jgi:hypothetical protein
MMRGMKLFPCSPMTCMRRSMMKAARAMYPVSSRKAMQPMRIMITGTNTMTALTPGMTPSTRRLVSSPVGRWSPAKVDRALKPEAIQSWGIFPRMKDTEYTSPKMRMKIGMPR